MENESVQVVQTLVSDPEVITRLDSLISLNEHIYVLFLFLIGVVASVAVMIFLYRAIKHLF